MFAEIPIKSKAKESLFSSGLGCVRIWILKLLQPFYDNKGFPYKYAGRWRETQFLGNEPVNQISLEATAEL